MDTMDRCKRLLSKHPSYTCYTNLRTPNDNGRTYGGTCVFVRNELLRYIIQVYYSLSDCVIMRISGVLFSTDRDVLLCCLYIPPEKSTCYNRRHEVNGIVALESVIGDLVNAHGDYIICAGDYNARVGNKQDFIVDDSNMFLPIADIYECDSFSIPRQSKDGTENAFGFTLRDLCCKYSMHMLNGRCGHDTSGEYTYMSAFGQECY
jgi:hypothetical protein